MLTGPVFRNHDPVFVTEDGDEVQISLDYWKVVAMVDQEGELSATGYLINQGSVIADIFEVIQEPKVFQHTAG